MRKLQDAALCGLLGAFLSACSFLPHAQSPTDTHTVYVWPLDRCPSIPAPRPTERMAPLFGLLAAILAGDLISALVGVPAAALAEAADADKKGFTATGTNPRFYYRASRDEQKQLQISPPGCYVVAYAGPGGSAPWCDNKSFSAGAAASCKNGRPLVESLHGKDHLKDQAEPFTKVLAVPEFYAEIGFDRSGYETIVRPKLVALYYPKSLLDPASPKARTMSVTLSFTSPANATDGLKAASIAMTIPGVTPAERIPDEVLVNAQTSWSSVPLLKPSDPVKEEGAYLPITIAATLHEVGDPSLFLAAFSKALSGSTGDISKAIGNAVLPAGQVAAQQQAQTNLASYYSAQSAALKANADYLAACAKRPSTEADKQAAGALYFNVIASRGKANIAASVANIPPPFAPVDTGITTCF